MEKINRKYKYFDTQEKDEEVLMVARRHWFVYVPYFLAAGIIYIISIVFMIIPPAIEIPIIGVSETTMTLFFGFLALFTLLFALVAWIVNYLDVQIVTNRHVVDIDQVGLFSRKISQLTLDNIQDVSSSKHGIWQSIFSFGNIRIQTAGELPNFLFNKVKDPYDKAKEIMEISGKYVPHEKGKGYREVVKKGKKE